MRIASLIVSSVIHLAIMGGALGLSARQAPARSISAIQIVRVSPPKPSPPESKAPVPKKREEAREALPAPAPPERIEPPARAAGNAEAETTEAPAFDSHLTLGNASPGGGVEVPVEAPRKPREEPRPLPAETKKLVPAAVAVEECDEAATKPRPIDRPTAIEYSAKARADGVEGRLVLKITVGPDGKVAAVEVTSSVDPALDEAAVEAVKSWRFEPGQRCGKATSATYTLARRFELGD